ncbi:MAG TPA: TOMM precursor leader peptide-binding protein, partial [Mycobacteriales bacterium]|nr:TOMM precursor leader peptide-binding protein [Mycobacteriales bacterium]
WGGGTPVACGHCLAVRWQRLRSRTEREALETGVGCAGVAPWPVLTGYQLDAVWVLYAAAHRGGPPAPALPPAALPPAGLPPAGLPPAGLPQVSTVDLASLRVRTFPVLADPRCPSCQQLTPDRPAGLDLASQPKRHPTAYRRTGADEFDLPADALANPVCGALGAGTMLTLTSPTTAPVTGSVFIRGYAGLLDVAWSGQANSFATSRSLALLEGLERYAGTHRRRPHTPVRGTYRELAGAALDPTDCGLYEDHVYRDDPLATPYDPDREMPWWWGFSLRDQRPILVAQRLCHYSSGGPGDGFAFATSSGCATGGSLAEAVLFGLLELIERDAFLLGWYGGARLTEIDLASVGSGRIRAMADRADLQGYQVHAFDNRIDLAVPVVTGLAVRRDGGPGTLCFAAGASLDPETAIEAALSEVLTYIPHLPRQVARRRAELEAMADDYGRIRQLADHSALFGLPRMRPHARAYLRPGAVAGVGEVYPTRPPASTDLLDDLAYVQGELTSAGHDVIVVDQTTPEQRRLGLHTVATIVPGLLPIDFGWARQRALRLPRLRTAFRRAGWRDTDLTDTELHRVPHPFP